jgi:hypothetical protein
MRKQTRNGTKRLLAVTLVVIASLAVSAGVARALPPDPYYGFNNLTVNNPNQCWAGCANSGFNNWDWSGVTKNSGDCIHIGFIDSVGFVYNLSPNYCSSWNGQSLHVTRTGVGAPQYNKGFCSYSSGNSSYVQCWMERF